jgi:hypothetical protein
MADLLLVGFVVGIIAAVALPIFLAKTDSHRHLGHSSTQSGGMKAPDNLAGASAPNITGGTLAP